MVDSISLTSWNSRLIFAAIQFVTLSLHNVTFPALVILILDSALTPLSAMVNFATMAMLALN